MKDPKRQPFWEKVKQQFSALTEETAGAPEPPELPAPEPKKLPARRTPTVRRTFSHTPGVEEDKLIKGGLRLKRSRYVTCPLPAVDYQTGDLLEPPPPPPEPAPESIDPLTLADTSDAARSPHRQRLIAAFMAGRYPLSRMREPQYMYRLVNEERDYHTSLLKACRREVLLARGEGSADVPRLEAQCRRHEAILDEMVQALKAITSRESSS